MWEFKLVDIFVALSGFLSKIDKYLRDIKNYSFLPLIVFELALDSQNDGHGKPLEGSL